MILRRARREVRPGSAEKQRALSGTALGMVAAVMLAGLPLALAAPASANGCAESFSGGSGASDSPFLISIAEDLTALKENASCWASQYNFQQTADIDMGGITWTDHAIGFGLNDGSNAFAGTYDGGSYRISGLNVIFNGDSTDGGSVAGLFGRFEGTVTNLGFSGNVSGTGSAVGGLVGYSGGFQIRAVVSNSYATGNVTGGGSEVGGLVGEVFYGTVSNSYATGSVSASGDFVGGLVGKTSDSVRNSYATGSVGGSGASPVGALIGTTWGTVEDSYATGRVTGSTRIGGLIGDNLSSVTSSFWDTETTGLTDGFGLNEGTFSATGASTAQMQSLSTFENADWSISDSWSASNTWGICEATGYPYLTWQFTSNDAACGSPRTGSITFTFVTSTGGVCFHDDQVAAGRYVLPTSRVACTPEGTELVGWTIPGQERAFSDGGVVIASADQTFTAVAKHPDIQVTFDPNVGSDTACLIDGGEVEPEQRLVSESLPRGGAIGEVAACAPDGHTLTGWTDRPTTDGPYAPVDGASLLTTGMEMPATWNHDPNPVNNIRLYAVWSPAG